MCLINTKQNKQIAHLRKRLEKIRWTIINEVETEFTEKAKWNIGDKTPNLIYSWSIQRSKEYQPLWLDFIAWYDYITFETYVNDCSCCKIRNTEIQLDFTRDKSLRKHANKEIWDNRIVTFLNQLNIIEKNQ